MTQQHQQYHRHRCLNNKEVGKQSEVFACAALFFFFLSLEYSYYDSCKFSRQNSFIHSIRAWKRDEAS